MPDYSRRQANETGGELVTLRGLAWEIERLRKIVAIEGDEMFSEEKYQHYRQRKNAGIVLVIAAPVLFITSVVFAIASQPTGISLSGEDYRDEKRTTEERSFLIVGWTTFSASVVSLGTGLPLLISGKRGMRRQLFLEKRGGRATSIEFNGAAFAINANSKNGMASLAFQFLFKF